MEPKPWPRGLPLAPSYADRQQEKAPSNTGGPTLVQKEEPPPSPSHEDVIAMIKQEREDRKKEREKEMVEKEKEREDKRRIAASIIHQFVRDQQLRTRAHRYIGPCTLGMNNTSSTQARISQLREHKTQLLNAFEVSTKLERNTVIVSRVIKLLTGRAIHQLISALTIQQWYKHICNTHQMLGHNQRRGEDTWATTTITFNKELRQPQSQHTTLLTSFSVHHSHTTWGPPPIDTVSIIKHDNTPTDDDGTSTTRKDIAATTLQHLYRTYQIQKQHTLHKAATQIQHWLQQYSHEQTMELPSLDLEKTPGGG